LSVTESLIYIFYPTSYIYSAANRPPVVLYIILQEMYQNYDICNWSVKEIRNLVWRLPLYYLSIILQNLRFLWIWFKS